MLASVPELAKSAWHRLHYHVALVSIGNWYTNNNNKAKLLINLYWLDIAWRLWSWWIYMDETTWRVWSGWRPERPRTDQEKLTSHILMLPFHLMPMTSHYFHLVLIISFCIIIYPHITRCLSFISNLDRWHTCYKSLIIISNN